MVRHPGCYYLARRESFIHLESSHVPGLVLGNRVRKLEQGLSVK